MESYSLGGPECKVNAKCPEALACVCVHVCVCTRTQESCWSGWHAHSSYESSQLQPIILRWHTAESNFLQFLTGILLPTCYSWHVAKSVWCINVWRSMFWHMCVVCARLLLRALCFCPISMCLILDKDSCFSEYSLTRMQETWYSKCEAAALWLVHAIALKNLWLGNAADMGKQQENSVFSHSPSFNR